MNNELKRTHKIDGIELSTSEAAAAAAASAQRAEVAEEVVDVIPVGGSSAAAASAASTGNGSSSAVAVSTAGSDTTLVASVGRSSLSTTKISLAPVVGYQWFQTQGTYFSVKNQYMVGFRLGGDFSQFAGVEAGMLYSRDTMKNRYTNYGYNYGYSPYNYGGAYYYNGYDIGQIGYYTRTRDSYDFGANLKLGYMKDTVRPYAVAGFSYLLQNYNIDDSQTKGYAESIGWKRTTTNTAANFGAGVDVSASNTLSFGARFDYQNMLNRKASFMHDLYADQSARTRLTGSLQLMF